MPFIVFEATDPTRISVMVLDDATGNTVREVAQGATLADVANAIDDLEVAAVKARCRTCTATMNDFRRGLESVALAAGLIPTGADVPVEVAAQ